MLKKIGAIFLLAISISHAHATLVNFTLVGEVYVANGPNIFGLGVGDAVTATATFDDSLITANPVHPDFPEFTYIDFSDTSLGIDMTITVGDIIYTNADEISGGPILRFTNGQFEGLAYEASDSTFNSVLYGFDGGWNFGGPWLSSSITAVPLPATAWLLASGLIGLIGFSRNKKPESGDSFL